MSIRDHGRYDIPFHFNGNLVVLKVTKFSTCDDVIHMVLHKVGLPITKVALYTVIERTSSLERKLPGRTLVYKVWRSWGCEREHFEFHIRSKETTKLGLKRNFVTKSSESSIDELFLDHYNKGAQTPKGKVDRSSRKNVTFNFENNSKREITSQRGEQSATSGKQMVLARYMYDLFKRSSKTKKNKTILSKREQGDGTENERFQCAYGSETNISQREKCSYVGDKYYATDSESESDEHFSDTSSEDSFIICNTGSVTLDTAFVKSSRDSDSDEGIDVTSVNSVDLDNAFIGELECNNDLNVTYDVQRPYTPTEDTRSEERFSLKESEFEMNISNDRVLKELFGKAGMEPLTSEDDEMDSFMRSRLDSF